MKLHKIFLINLLLTLLCSCAPSKPVIFEEPKPLPLMIRTVPDIALVYTELHLICKLPSDVGDGVFSFGVSDMFRSTGPIDRIQYSRDIVVPCEPFTIFCAYQEVGKDIVSITKTVEPVGECRAR